MNWKLTQLGDNITVAYAADELHNYLSRMDRTARISRIAARSYDEKNAQALYIGCDAAFAHLLPKVEDPRRDDAVYINVSGGAGIITGTNPRSVLIAVYRYLRALGCAFLRPGKDGDIIPACSPQTTPVYIAEAASYRHRAVCIEGAVSYEHVADMIDFLPKIAMNGYFVQFKKPYEFFERWYQHGTNPTMPAEPMTEAKWTACTICCGGKFTSVDSCTMQSDILGPVSRLAYKAPDGHRLQKRHRIPLHRAWPRSMASVNSGAVFR